MTSVCINRDNGKYTADLSADGAVTVYVHRNRLKVLAGTGSFGANGIEDCSADLSEYIYGELSDALAEAVVAECARQDSAEGLCC